MNKTQHIHKVADCNHLASTLSTEKYVPKINKKVARKVKTTHSSPAINRERVHEV
jgi:hypothetical protein